MSYPDLMRYAVQRTLSVRIRQWWADGRWHSDCKVLTSGGATLAWFSGGGISGSGLSDQVAAYALEHMQSRPEFQEIQAAPRKATHVADACTVTAPSVE